MEWGEMMNRMMCRMMNRSTGQTSGHFCKNVNRASLALSALALTVLTGLGFTVASHEHDLCHGFVPENDMKIPVGWRTRSGGLSEAQYNDVLDRMERLFKDVVAQQGGDLIINRKWTDPTVNASAQQWGTSWILNMYGGLARHSAIGVEGFALVACHELGHHIGGAPKMRGWMGNNWATNEGGADYYATLKCLRRFFVEDDNAAIIAQADIDPFARQQCEAQFTDDNDRLICLRNSMAGMQVASLFMDLRGDETAPRFDTPDPTVVTQTDDRHPLTQCRLDTYFNGGICNVDASIPVSSTDYRQGSCIEENHTAGLRPRCWFKPTSIEEDPEEPEESEETPIPTPIPEPIPMPVSLSEGFSEVF